ncbi:MAG: hypothetical protein H6508_02125 [Calditrichaeota bacterium]|nr:hypothetical protein [Calditrichota bacterium]
MKLAAAASKLSKSAKQFGASMLKTVSGSAKFSKSLLDFLPADAPPGALPAEKSQEFIQPPVKPLAVSVSKRHSSVQGEKQDKLKQNSTESAAGLSETLVSPPAELLKQTGGLQHSKPILAIEKPVHEPVQKDDVATDLPQTRLVGNRPMKFVTPLSTEPTPIDQSGATEVRKVTHTQETRLTSSSSLQNKSRVAIESETMPSASRVTDSHSRLEPKRPVARVQSEQTASREKSTIEPVSPKTAPQKAPRQNATKSPGTPEPSAVEQARARVPLGQSENSHSPNTTTSNGTAPRHVKTTNEGLIQQKLERGKTVELPALDAKPSSTVARVSKSAPKSPEAKDVSRTPAPSTANGVPTADRQRLSGIDTASRESSIPKSAESLPVNSQRVSLPSPSPKQRENTPSPPDALKEVTMVARQLPPQSPRSGLEHTPRNTEAPAHSSNAKIEARPAQTSQPSPSTEQVAVRSTTDGGHLPAAMEKVAPIETRPAQAPQPNPLVQHVAARVVADNSHSTKTKQKGSESERNNENSKTIDVTPAGEPTPTESKPLSRSTQSRVIHTKSAEPLTKTVPQALPLSGAPTRVATAREHSVSVDATQLVNRTTEKPRELSPRSGSKDTPRPSEASPSDAATRGAEATRTEATSESGNAAHHSESVSNTEVKNANSSALTQHATPRSTQGTFVNESLRVALQQALEQSRKRLVEPDELRLTLSMGEFGALDIDVLRENEKFTVRIAADPSIATELDEQRLQLVAYLREQGLLIQQLDVVERPPTSTGEHLRQGGAESRNRAGEDEQGSRSSSRDSGKQSLAEQSPSARPSFNGKRVWTA